MKKYYIGVLFILTILQLLVGTANLYSQCPTAPTTCKYTVSASSSASFNVAANETLCINSGTYTGSIGLVASTGTIYVAPGAVFNPTVMNNFGGRLIICGTATLPGFNFDNSAGLAKIENYNYTVLNGSYGFNNASTWYNGLKSTMIFNNNITMNSVTFTNNGNILMKGSFTMNTGVNTFINHDSLTALGNISLNASIYNDGYLLAKGSDLTLNASGNIVNACYFKSDGAFTYNGQDTLFITGLTMVTGLKSNSFIVQGKAVNMSSGSFVQGIDFSNNGTPIIGKGNLIFSGYTVNQGPFGNDGQGLNFYDSGIPSGGKYFDLQNTNPHSSVTKTAIAPKDSNYVPPTCSNLIRCNITFPGNDTTICGSSINLIDANPNSPLYEAWRTVSGNPASATINSVTGEVTGMTVSGTYQFEIYKTTTSTCKNTIKVTVVTPPVNSTVVSGNKVCRNGNTNATVTVKSSELGVTYRAYLGTNLFGTGTGTGSDLSISGLVSSLADGENILTFKASKSTCATVDLTDTAMVYIYPNQNPAASVSVTSPICSGQTTKVTISATKGITYQVKNESGVVLGSATASSTGALEITTSVLSASVPTTLTLTVIAKIANCTDVELTTHPTVLVNPKQNANAFVSASSPICSGNKSTVTIFATKGVTYTVYNSKGTQLASQTATSSDTLKLVTSTLTATNAPLTDTLKVIATVGTCADVELVTHPIIIVNPFQSASASVTAISPICSGQTTKVTISATKGITYQVKNESGVVIGSATAASTGALEITTSAFTATEPKTFTLTVIAKITNCSDVELTTHPTVLVNPKQNANAFVSAFSPICSGNKSTVTIFATKGVTYTVYNTKGTQLASQTATSTDSLKLVTSTLTATNAPVTDTLKVIASIGSCSDVELTTHPQIVINPSQNINASVSALSPICSGTKTTVSISAIKGITYTLRDANTLLILGSKKADSTGLLTIQTSTLSATTEPVTYSIKVTASVGGCTDVELTTIPKVLVNPDQSVSSSVTAISPKCSGEATVVSISATNGILYTIKDQTGTVVGSQTASSTGTLDVSTSILTATGAPKSYTLSVIASIAGCKTDTLTQKPVVVVNPVQDPNASVTAISPICSNQTTTVTINGTSGITYEVYNSSTLIGTKTATSSGNLTITTSALTAVAAPTTYSLSVIAKVAGCSNVNLTTKPSVLVNPIQDSTASVSVVSPVCSGSSTTISINATQGITYTVYNSSNAVVGSGTAVSSGILNIVTSVFTATEPSTQTFKIIASVAGCSPITLKTKPSVLVNPNQNLNAAVTATSPICSGSSSTVTIAATKGIKYVVKDSDGIILGSATASSTGSLVINTAAITSTIIGKQITLIVEASIDGCSPVELATKPKVIVNKSPNSIIITGETICSTTDSVHISLLNVESGVTYQAYLGTTAIGSSVVGPKAIISIANKAPFVAGVNTVTLKNSIGGCTTVTNSDTATVTINSAPTEKSFTVTSPVCEGTFATVSLTSPQSGVTYTVYDLFNSTKSTLSPVLNTSGIGNYSMSGVGVHTISIDAKIAGCSTLNFVATKTVQVNTGVKPVILAGIPNKPICKSADSVKLTITNPETSVDYNLYKVVGSTETKLNSNALNTTNSSFTIKNIGVGETQYVIKATIGGCGTAIVSSFKVNVDSIINISRPVLNAGNLNICELNSKNILVSLSKTQAKIKYVLKDNGVSLKDTIITTAANQIINFGPFNFNVGTHIFTVDAYNEGCGWATLNTKDTIIVSDSLNSTTPKINAGTSNLCKGVNNTISVKISNTQKDVTYDLFDNGVSLGIKKKAVSTNEVLDFSPLNLSVGIHVFSAKILNAGCSEITLTSKDTVWVSDSVQTKTPKLNAGLAQLCQGANDSVTVILSNAQAGVSYELLNNGVQLGITKASTDASRIILFGPHKLNVGTHIFTVRAFNEGCSAVILTASDTVTVNDSLNKVRPILNAGLQNLCQGVNDEILIEIKNVQKNVNYQLYNNNVAILSPKSSLVENATLTFGPVKLTLGEHIFSAKITNNGCTSLFINSKDTVIVSDSVNTKLPKLDVGQVDVCEGTNNVASIKLLNSQKNVYYQLIDNSTSVLADTMVTINGLTIDFGSFTFAKGAHKLTVKAANLGCDTVLLATSDSVNVNTLIDSNNPKLKADTSVICSNGAVMLKLENAQIGVTYSLFNNGNLQKTIKATGNSVDFGSIAAGKDSMIFTLNAHNNACEDTILTSVKIIVNDEPNTNLFKVELSDSVLCNNSDLYVYVIKSRNATYNYTVLDYRQNIAKVLDTKIGNSDTLIFGPFTSLGTGNHLIKVVESVQNCLSDTTAGIDLLINNTLDVSKPKVLASDSIVCEKNSISVKITNTSLGNVYKIKDNGKYILDSLVSKFDGEELNFGPIVDLDTGLHVFTATIENAGCGLFTLTSSDTVLVNKLPSKNILATNNSPICVGSQATIVVDKTKSVKYYLYNKIDTTLVSGPSESILKTNTYTSAGSDSLIVIARIAGCSDVVLDTVQYITINKIPTDVLSADVVSICNTENAKVFLKGTTSTFVYKATLLSGVSDTSKGSGNLEFVFNPSTVKSPVDTVTYSVSVPGCGDADLFKSVIYKMNDTIINNYDVICEDSVGHYVCKGVLGASDYKWNVPLKAFLLSSNMTSASVKWADTSSSGDIVVNPISTSGTVCLNNKTMISVKVYNTFKGDADFVEKKLLCVGDIDTVGIVSVIGIAKDSLIVDESNFTLISTYKDQFGNKKYVIRYDKPQQIAHKFVLESYCGSDSVYVSDSVKVLGYPMVNAGEYPVYEMSYFPREVVLDGTQSSKGNFSYKWTDLTNGSNINNSNTLIASMIPQQAVTVVELTITNEPSGMCSAKDTATIKVDLGIFVPNVFTPNGDGDHDVWVLQNVNAFYPNATVDIYSKWGTHLYSAVGYSNNWDGKRNGEDLPAATYYYVIDLKKPGFKPLAGSVTIIR
ncbi:MAG: gliding motility-associated C-terminal domain-containing protein [Cytophagales bacterium]